MIKPTPGKQQPLGDNKAAGAYRCALKLVANASEKDYLMRRLAETES